MSTERELFERAIAEAYARQTELESSTSSESARRIVARGRRRRALRGLCSIVVVAVIATGAVAAVGAVRDDRDRLPPAEEGPPIGAKKVMELGGPIAASQEALFVANDYLTNGAGDRASIARLDLATGKVTNTDPSTLPGPQNVAMGRSGLWVVGWSGDLPLADDGSSRAGGAIQLVDPVSGEVHLDLPRENSAPQDVAAGEANGREVAWVVDMGRGELLEVDAASGAIETIDVGSSQNNVAVGAGAVWMSSNPRGVDGGQLTRYEPASGSVETFPVDHCMNDLVVLDASVWALDYCGKAVHRFDAASGEKLASVSIGEAPYAITAADGLIWVVRESDVVRVDPATAQVVGAPTVLARDLFDAHITAVDETVYVSSWNGVYRLGEGLPVREPLPPPTPEPEETREPLAAETCSLDNVTCIPLDSQWSVAGAGFDSAWVGDFEIARFDAETGEEVARLDTDGFVQGFAPDGRWMWALLDASEHVTLLKIDPETTSVSASFDLGDAGNIGAPSVAAGGGNVWVSLPRGSVTRVSASDGETTTTSYADDLPGYGASNGPLHLAFGDAHLWLSYGTGHLGVVDPSSDELVRIDRDALGVSADDIIVAAGAVWSPHQDAETGNVISYSSTSGPDDGRGRVVLAEAIPELAASDGDTIWVTQSSFDENEPGLLVAVDAQTHELVGEPIEVDLEFEESVAAGDGYVWVTGYEVLYRITPPA